MSSEKVMKHGVPQGSVLEPILFLIYINDLSALPLTGRITCFADDTSIFYRGKSYREIQTAFQNDEKIISKYFRDNMLSLNVKNTKVIAFSSKEVTLNNLRLYIHDHDTDVVCSCQPLSLITNLKYLGVFLDSKLTWATHISDLARRLRTLNRMLYFLSEHFSRDQMRGIYQALYESVLTYGILHWGNAAQSLRKRVQVAQNYAIKSIIGYSYSKNMRTKGIYKSTNLRPVSEIYKYRASIFAFKHPTLFGIQLKNSRLRSGVNLTAGLPPWKLSHTRLQTHYSRYSKYLQFAT